jgi:hypothetical protein
MGMVERVANAILEATDEAMFPDDAIKCARAAIEAMREPTEAMSKQGNWCGDGFSCSETWFSGAPNVWQAMIDEALKDG